MSTYAELLRNRRLSILLLGDLLSYMGSGMIMVALPLQTLRIHGSVPAAIAIALVEIATYLLGAAVSFGLGLGRWRVPPKVLVLGDCLLRGTVYTGLGLLAINGLLTLWMLVAGLLLGSALRLAGSSGRRLLATGMAGKDGLLAVNSLIGTGSNLALYVAGPVLGGILAVVSGPGIVFMVDVIGTLALSGAVLVAVPRSDQENKPVVRSEGGWRILRRFPIATRLFGIVFLFNLCYMPVEIALPLLVQGPLHSNGAGFGLMWGVFGAATLLGALVANQLRRLSQRRLLTGIIGGWGVSVLLLAYAPNLPLAVLAFALGGFIWAPFTPVAYSLVQSLVGPDEQEPVVTLWTAGSTIAAPIGLALGGPLVGTAGIRGGLVVSGILTLALVPWAAWGLKAGV